MEHSRIESAPFDLFNMSKACLSINAKRVANDDECRAYAKWLAMKAGVVEAVTESPNLKWRTIDRNNRVCIGAQFGEAFVPFPGADDNGAVTFELLNDSGEVETAGTIYAKPNGALNIAAADVLAMKESGKAWAKANKAKDKAKPIAPPIVEPAPDTPLSSDYDAPQTATETPQDIAPATTLSDTPEIAPQDEKIALADDLDAPVDALAALIARIEALELAIVAQVKPLVDQVTPTSQIETTLPAQLKPKRSAAHIRAIMAYLTMRALRGELASERNHNAIGMQQLDDMRHKRDTCRLDAMDYRDKLNMSQDKRRRAILKAREFQQRLYAEHKIVDKQLAAKRELVQDIFEIAEKEKAAVAESERLRKVAYQQAGHIQTVAERLDRAEAILRTQAPGLALVPPISLAVAA